MTLNMTGPGFSTELEATPDAITMSGDAVGKLGFCFANFVYREPGSAIVAVEGVQIGACISSRGVSFTTSGTFLELGGDAIITRTPGTVSSSRWLEGFCGHFLSFAPESIERFFGMSLRRIDFETKEVVAPAATQPVISHLLAAVANDLAAGNPGGVVFVESLGAAALHSIIKLPTDHKLPSRGLTSEQAKVIRDLIHDRLSEPVSLVDLAKAVRMSVGHMLRSFKLTFGVTPHQYIIRERVECAQRLLETTQMGIDEIVAEAGFSSRAHMTRTFRTTVGVLPKSLR